MKKITVSIGILLSLTTAAQAAGNPAAGKEKAAVCGACHGVDGNSAIPTFPKLAGQAENYLLKQLTDLRSGARKDPIMSGQAAAINEADIPDLVAYFSSQTRVPGAAADAVLAERGLRIYKGGDVATGVPACASCHGPHGAGNPAARYPSLNGQHSLYVMTQLQHFKSGDRSNGPMMNDSVARMTEDDMKAVAEYIAGLH